MSGHHGVHRFLSKREKHGPGKHAGHHKEKERLPEMLTEKAADKNTVRTAPSDDSSPADYYGLFLGPEKAADSQEELKVKALRKKMVDQKSVIMKDTHILYALHSNFSQGDSDKAFDLLMAISDSFEGLVMDYDPKIKMLGAENRGGVTCYLDSTLFAIFSRLEIFEAMLYNTFDDLPRCRLALLLRMWVNLLRSGKLITTDITKLLQRSLAECGWADAARLCQQDASEAFTFITGKLELPLLTLKMDIYHTGKEDATDDHKFINERLLEVAIPSDSSGGSQAITLEDCLESYFNNRIEVRRYLERRTTLSSSQSYESGSKNGAIHVETVELDSDYSPMTPTSSSPGFPPPLRHRSTSIVQQRFIPDRNEDNKASTTGTDARPGTQGRKGSIRKEVMMPAWQFFSLIPWYTDNTPTNDAQVAAHFSSRRPVLGMCLKRYSMTPRGEAIRLSTQIDIPIEIGLPHFIQDDHIGDDGPIYGNFKLSLQSVVCHRGNSVESGHYISLVRSTTPSAAFHTTPSSVDDSKHWMRFDDLASQRITAIDIEKALRDETPYLLFYQIVPVDGDPGRITDGERTTVYSGSNGHDSGIAGLSRTSLNSKATLDDKSITGRPSIEINDFDSERGRSPVLDARRSSIAFSEPGFPSVEVQETERLSNSSLDPQARKKDSHNRSQSQLGERLTRSLSKMAARRSREVLPIEITGDPEVKIREVGTGSTLEPDKGKTVLRKEVKREKSKNRPGKSSATLSKARAERPDRECSVM